MSPAAGALPSTDRRCELDEGLQMHRSARSCVRETISSRCRRRVGSAVVAGIVVCGACQSRPGTPAVHVDVGAADHVHLSVRASDAPRWYATVTPNGSAAIRVPATGALRVGPSYTVSVGRGGGGHTEIAVSMFRCASASDTGCVAVQPQSVRDARGWAITGMASGARALHVALSVDSVAPATRSGGDVSEPAGEVAIGVALETPASPGSFTTRVGENVLRLRATPAVQAAGGTVVWHIAGVAPVAGWVLTADPGESTTVQLASPPPTRWASIPHPGELSKKALALQVAATSVVSGHTYTLAPLVIQQDEVSTIRQEYIDLGVAQGVPPAAVFVRTASSPSLVGQQANNGDYHYFISNTGFMAVLDSLRAEWGTSGAWQMNGFYRNPVHNRYHVDGGKSSGTVPASWHQYGCAADLQVFPPTDGSSAHTDSLALNFWRAMSSAAQDLGLAVEPLVAQGHAYGGLGHVHVERRCPP